MVRLHTADCREYRHPEENPLSSERMALLRLLFFHFPQWSPRRPLSLFVPFVGRPLRNFCDSDLYLCKLCRVAFMRPEFESLEIQQHSLLSLSLNIPLSLYIYLYTSVTLSFPLFLPFILYLSLFFSFSPCSFLADIFVTFIFIHRRVPIISFFARSSPTSRNNGYHPRHTHIPSIKYYLP